jgi:PTH1 family peptidyl-tRNA hydrolase
VFLVVGLGNPGSKYQNHRHNVGFMVVERLAERHAREPFREKFQGQFAKASLDALEFGLLKPQTFMNLSGESAQKALAFFKIEPAKLIVVHDELDLPFGTVRVKVGGGAAGHNGIKSIAQCCGGPDFVRIRVGIGRPRSGAGANYVLSDFSREECFDLPSVVESASLAASDVMKRGPQAAMNLHNQANPSTKAPAEAPNPKAEKKKDERTS